MNSLTAQASLPSARTAGCNWRRTARVGAVLTVVASLIPMYLGASNAWMNCFAWIYWAATTPNTGFTFPDTVVYELVLQNCALLPMLLCGPAILYATWRAERHPFIPSRRRFRILMGVHAAAMIWPAINLRVVFSQAAMNATDSSLLFLALLLYLAAGGAAALLARERRDTARGLLLLVVLLLAGSPIYWSPLLYELCQQWPPIWDFSWWNIALSCGIIGALLMIAGCGGWWWSVSRRTG